MTLVRYDTARGPSGGPTPGAIALRDHWRKTTGLGDMGIYNPRAKRGSRGWSVHAEGRAVDLAANVFLNAEKATADRHCQFLIDNSVALQCQYLIWNRRSWKSGRGWQSYSGTSPHTDHIHAELNRDGARTVTVAQLDALWRAWTNDHDPEDDMPKTLSDVINYVALLYGAAGNDHVRGQLDWVDRIAKEMDAGNDQGVRDTITHLRSLLKL